MPRSALPARAPILLFLLLLGACQTASSPFRDGVASTRTGVEVHNDHWESLGIYLDRDGVRTRLGVVEGNTTRLLKVPDECLAAAGWVRLVAVETGRRDHASSEMFAIHSGEKATWRTGPTDHATPVVVTAFH